MLNHVVLVGRLVRTPELNKTESGKSIMTITLAVTKPYKNMDGEYESDFIECTLFQGIAENTLQYVKKGDLIGVKGHLGSYQGEKEGEKYYKTNQLIVERVTFLSSKEKEEVKEEKKKKQNAE